MTPGAGSIRNYAVLRGAWHALLREQKADLLLAFPGNYGTANCIMHATELGITVEKAPND